MLGRSTPVEAGSDEEGGEVYSAPFCLSQTIECALLVTIDVWDGAESPHACS